MTTESDPTKVSSIPWAIAHNRVGAIFILNSTGKFSVANTFQREVDAEFAVKAVNQHDALVAALKAFIQTVDDTGGLTEHTGEDDGGPVGAPDWFDLSEAYKMAVAAVGVEQPKTAEEYELLVEAEVEKIREEEDEDSDGTLSSREAFRQAEQTLRERGIKCPTEVRK